MLLERAPAVASPSSNPSSPLQTPGRLAPQIIAKVQSQGGAGLVVPGAEDLPGGPFSCYPQFMELMRACWNINPEARPTFGVIKEQLA